MNPLIWNVLQSKHQNAWIYLYAKVNLVIKFKIPIFHVFITAIMVWECFDTINNFDRIKQYGSNCLVGIMEVWGFLH